MFDDNEVYIGTRSAWGDDVPCALHQKDRRQHLYTIGQTGTGKSSLLCNLITQDIALGHGIGLIDPHGDLAEAVLANIPSHRVNDVVYFNPADTEYPIGLNLLENVPEEQRNLVASGIVATLKGIWPDFFGPRMEYILLSSILALLDCENTSILGIQRMLVDEKYRSWVLRQVTNPSVRAFWFGEFARYDKRFLAEAIAPIQNKIGQLVLAPTTRNILGQIKSGFDTRFIIDNKRIFIASLSKGRLGDDKANLLGAILLTLFQLSAMRRTDIPEHERNDFHLYIDEFQSFSTTSFVSILSEARKYRLCLTLSHQYIKQLPQSLQDGIFGNVGTLISLRVGQSDATVLSEQFGGGLVPRHFTDLGNHRACVKQLSGGEYGEPFFCDMYPPVDMRCGKREQIIKTSRQRYGTKRDVVEERIERWMNQDISGH
ncbi:MAG: hypothetical protein CMJ19_06920 [Phycisphaeraceae bacterium]|nr:hypothetical protein [Phycisphaeraceae bacterium]